MRTRKLAMLLLLPLLALVVAACGSSNKSNTSTGGAGTAAAKTDCTAQVAVEAPITGPVAQLGGEQLHFAQLAADEDNAANGTKITIVQGDTQLEPKQATTVTRQFVSNDKIVAIVGPAGSQEVSAIGSAITRAGLPAISGSATNTDLTQKGNVSLWGDDECAFRVPHRNET